MNKTYRILLRKQPSFTVEDVLYGEYEAVAQIAGLEGHWQVSEIAQNAFAPWHTDPRVKLLADGRRIVDERGGLRSFSTGDIVAVNVTEKFQPQRVSMWMASPDGFVPVKMDWRECQQWLAVQDA